MATATETPLKQLNFVKDAADAVVGSSYYAKAWGVYSGIHSHKLLKGPLTAIESRIAPYVEKAPSVFDQLLISVDGKADNYLTAIGDSVNVYKGKINHIVEQATNNSYVQSNIVYIKSLEKAVIQLSQSGVKVPAELFTNLNTQLATARTYLEGVLAGTQKFSVDTIEKTREQIIATWESLASQPAVKNAVEKLLPVLSAAKDATVVKAIQVKESELSKKYMFPAVAKLGSYVNQVQETERYQTYVSPVVTKAISTEAYAQMEKTVVALVDSLKEEMGKVEEARSEVSSYAVNDDEE